jgi:hypothetical protein
MLDIEATELSSRDYPFFALFCTRSVQYSSIVPHVGASVFSHNEQVSLIQTDTYCMSPRIGTSVIAALILLRQYCTRMVNVHQLSNKLTVLTC